MRKIVLVLVAALLAAGGVGAQDLTLSGEVRTGLYTEQETIGNGEPVEKGGATNNDGDSGSGDARIRLDLNFTYGIVGLRLRFQIEPGEKGPFLPTWSYAYAYGNLLNEQITISAGLLGESPWGTGGPKLRSEPESREYIGYNDLSRDSYTVSEGLLGIRLEYKPSFVPGLNIGFVLNQPDQTTIAPTKQTFGDVFGESVIGVAYEHDYFAVRLGYRFDSNADTYDNGANEGSRLTYRLEERFLTTLMPGMQISLNGEYYGIGSEKRPVPDRPDLPLLGAGEYFINWLYWLWDSDNFITQFHVCFSAYQSYNNNFFKPDIRQEYQSLEFLPAFYYKFFNNLLHVGLKLGFGMEFGPGKTYLDSPYQYIFVEPQVRLNIGGVAYIAAVYNWTDRYALFDNAGSELPVERRGEKSVKHSVNIRAVYTF